MMYSRTKSALDSRARRAAQRIGLMARKTRWRAGTFDNWGEFMLIEPFTNAVVDGARFDMYAEEVIAYCGEGLAARN
jgi:hypothetical protein